MVPNLVDGTLILGIPPIYLISTSHDRKKAYNRKTRGASIPGTFR